MIYEHNSTINIDTIFYYYNFIEKIKKQYPDANWVDCLSKGQIKSKLWLIDNLLNIKKDLGTIFILGGWYGTLSRFIFESELKLDCIRSFDLDDCCYEIAETINRSFVMDNWKFKATTLNIFNINYPLSYDTLRRNGTAVKIEENPDTIINTSCEHMIDDWFIDVPDKTLVILQSNDFEEAKGHINCVEDINDMIFKYPMVNLIYADEIRLDGFTRYMLIGEK